MYIATEDALSEAVAQKLIATYTHHTIEKSLGKKGNGHLKINLKSYCEIAKRVPFLLITDLDTKPCAAQLRSEWCQGINITLPNNMIFRVAVREMEAWLLADHDAIRDCLRIANPPHDPDDMPDPKARLIQWARTSKNKEFRSAVAPTKGACASQGFGYNRFLVGFVNQHWCPERAKQHSDSLKRCIERLKDF